MSFAAIFAAAKFWHWWIAGVLLMIIELTAPGAFFLWMGISAFVTGFVLLVLPSMGWQYQFLVFALFTVVSIIAWKRYLKSKPITTDRPGLNRRGEQYIGREFTVSEAIVNGVGKVRISDTSWKIEGKDMPKGTKIKVTGTHGTVLKVERTL